ncbi:Iron-sulfur cluster regulator IscR [hydrothermal vent metagenome]|uniref:Iron-sulfur cluster regulator IscR n=1 Tax=hydrothermal vent metagenome TaxID=652676 RepID=A0A3B1BR50_9ZZZZ
MKISTKGHYAVQALVDMASQPDNRPIALGVIAERQDLSQNYLEQLFVKLRKAGLVSSVRGPGGGYLLAKSSAVITIGDVFSAVDESLIFTECAIDEQTALAHCSKACDCSTQLLWVKLCNHFNDILFSVTIDDVVKGNIDLSATIQNSVNTPL